MHIVINFIKRIFYGIVVIHCILVITGPPSRPVLFCSLTSVVCRRRLSSVGVDCNAAGGRAGRPPGVWAVGRPTLHDGSVRLRPVRAIPCFS